MLNHLEESGRTFVLAISVMCLHVICAMSITFSLSHCLSMYSSYISFDENLLGLDNKLQPYTFQTHAGECPSIFGHTYAAKCVCMCVIPNVSGI